MGGKRSALKQCSFGNFFVRVKLTKHLEKTAILCQSLWLCSVCVSAIAKDVLPCVGKRMGHKVGIRFRVVNLPFYIWQKRVRVGYRESRKINEPSPTLGRKTGILQSTM